MCMEKEDFYLKHDVAVVAGAGLIGCKQASDCYYQNKHFISHMGSNKWFVRNVNCM